MSLRGLAYWRETWPLLRRDATILGWKHVIRDMWNMKKAQWGEIRGVDSHGNRYMENLNHAEMCRRWVLYPHRRIDPTSVTPEWHMWLHRQVEETPDEMHLPRYRWQLPTHTSSDWHLSRMGYQPEFIPKGYYTRAIGLVPPVGHLVDRQTQSEPPTCPSSKKVSRAQQEGDASVSVEFTPTSASAGPSSPATPAPDSRAAQLDTEEEGSPILTHNGKLYEAWEKIKRGPKMEPIQERF